MVSIAWDDDGGGGDGLDKGDDYGDGDDDGDDHLHPVQFHQLHRQSSQRTPQTQSQPVQIFITFSFVFQLILSFAINLLFNISINFLFHI